MASNLKPGIYKHYQGTLYKLIGVGKYIDSNEDVVLYQELYGDQNYFVCPLNRWEQDIGAFTGIKRFAWVRLD